MSGNDEVVTFWLSQAGRVPLLTPAEELHLGALVRAWQDHPDGPAQAPPGVIRRGRKARDRMVAANLRLVSAVAQKAPWLERADALQEGAIGLQRAAEKFDPERGYKFSTYAYWWIRQAIQREGETQCRLIRVPSHLAQSLACLDARRAELEQRLGRSPTLAELAARMKVPERELELYLSRGRWHASLDVGVGNGDSCLIDVIASPQPQDDPQLQHLADQIDRLPPRLARLIRAHHGIGEPQRTTTELAEEEGCTPHRIQQLLRDALARLRRGCLAAELAEQLEQLEISLDRTTPAAAPGPTPDDAGPAAQPELPGPPAP